MHLLRTRAESVERRTRSLAEGLKNSVERREGLAERAGRAEERRRRERRSGRGGAQVSRAMAARRAEDLRNRIRKMCKEESNLRLVLTKAKAKEEGLRGELQRNTAFLEKVCSFSQI